MIVLSMLENGSLRTQDENGLIAEIGPEHPDYQRLVAECRASVRPTLQSCLRASLFILVGAASWWYVWHQLATEGFYSRRLSIVGPLAIPFGILFMFRPQWSGPSRQDTPGIQKVGVVVTLAICTAAFALNDYLMQHYRP